MQRSVEQTERVVILNMGRLSVATRNTKTAEDTLSEIKKGGTDTHALAVAAGKQADAAKKQSSDTELIAKATQSQATTTIAVASAARSSAEISAKELELSERPWVDALMTIDGPFEFNVNGVNVHFKFQLVNTGHSPALATHISPRMTSVFSEGANANDILAQTCSGATREVVQSPGFGVTLFPNRPLEESISFGMGKEDIENASKKIPGQITWPEIVVCIGYRSTFTDKVYHTGYVLDLGRTDATGTPRVDFKIGEDIDKSHLSFRCGVSNCIVAD
jgi:hypothetical protein